MPTVIDELVINSPYEEPSEYWRYDRDRFEFKREQRRRPSGYMVATKAATTDEDPGDFVELPLVNRIRKRVGAWRAAGWPGATGVTRRLLEHWWDEGRAGDAAVLFLPVGGGGDADLVAGSAGGRAGGD